jgi:hypothetical protein
MTYPWAERVIAALGDYHDEEECDGPDDLIDEIHNLRSRVAQADRSVLISRVYAAERVLGAYRVAQIAAHEFDEGDEEMERAWRDARLAHVAYDPGVA